MREPQLQLVPSEDGVVVAVHDYGGGGVPVLFLHGTGMCGRMWEPVIDRLPADRMRFLTVDLRGHGLTVTPEGTEFHDHRMIADLTSVIDQLGIEGGFAVGHSMGGGTIILTSIDRPSAFQRIWTYEPIVMAPNTKRADPEFLEGIRRRRRTFPDRQTVFDRYSTRAPLDELHRDCLWAYLRHGFADDPSTGHTGAVTLRCRPDHEADAFEQFDRAGFTRAWSVTTPVLVASGGAEPDYPPAISAPLLATALPQGHHEWWPASRHFGPFSELDTAAESIEAWFEPY